MRLVLEGEAALRLEADASAALSIESAHEAVALSPFHMLAASLASCTWSVLWTWAQHAHLYVDDLAVRVTWHFAEQPLRVGAMNMELLWPSLPPQRRTAAARAAEQCTVHTTLSHATSIHISLADG